MIEFYSYLKYICNIIIYNINKINDKIYFCIELIYTRHIEIEVSYD